MDEHFRTRVLLLCALAVVGVAIAGIGTALGVDGPAGSEPATEFTISKDDVTVTDGDGNVTVVDDLTSVRSVEIAETDGTFKVDTDEDDPFNPAERERAVAIATNNETVREHLADLEAYELEVEPIQQLNVSSTDAYEVTLNATDLNGTDSNETGATLTAEFEAVEVEEGAITVDRDPSYLEDEAVVRIVDPETGDQRYAVDVDLAAERVTGITDWAAIRSGS